MNHSGILKNKLFLYLTEFFAGMSVMAVELGASRLLAPYFSSSQIVWTIVIGTIMIAMALGTADLYRQQQFPHHCGVCSLHGDLRVPLIFTGNCDPFSGKIFRG